ncbi:hypothetical protein C7974DRAFT_322131, partial [Boeremia exigua]|uniref:uncharacterized protein n=1 Tax=Boeremia exigua TaxID=749465 RepID=UPI001E8E7EF1
MIRALPEIFVHLSSSDRRTLRSVNHQFYSTVKIYQTKLGKCLTTFPNEIILEIIQYLRIRDQSRFARVSRRFYPLIMDALLRDNIRYKGSSLLQFSVRRDLRSFTRRIICRGGDVNTTTNYLRTPAVLPRPLSVATYYGYADMVNLLLELGAHPFSQSKDIPLAFAISKGHERVALLLLHALKPINGKSYIADGELLRRASAAKMVTLVSHLLERRSEFYTSEIDAALYQVLLGEMSKENIFQRSFHNEVFQIVLLLLRNGANPDVQ